MRFVCLLCVFFVSEVVAEQRYRCPSKDQLASRCHCSPSGARGIQLRCATSNLAIVSVVLKNLKTPIEVLEISGLNATRLFGPLFDDVVVYSLRLVHSGISDVDESVFHPIRDVVESLSLEGNRFEAVPVSVLSNFRNLSALNLAKNRFTKIPDNAFGKLANLTQLDLGYNNLSKIEANAFVGISSLEKLDLQNNQLRKLEKNVFRPLKKLKYLDLSHNLFNDFSRNEFNELGNLWYLNISHNALPKLGRSLLVRNSQLRVLNVSYNRLEEIDSYLLKGVRFLRDFAARGNKIKTIARRTFGSTTRLKSLDFSGNALQDVASESFKDLQWLDILDLSYNKIAKIERGAFQRMFKVAIDLSHNNITSIGYGAFQDMFNITLFDLSYNNIREVKSESFHTTDATVLLLNHNKIFDSSKIQIGNMTGLQFLNLSHNSLKEINRKSLTSGKLYEMHTIDLSHNAIVDLSGALFEKLASIRYIRLQHNQIKKIGFAAFGTLATLLELDISHNNISEIANGGISNLISVRTIFANDNRIKKMFAIPVALNSLHLQNNLIEKMGGSPFPMINSLLELFLDNNNISILEAGVFNNLLTLKTLSLSRNYLTEVPRDALQPLTSLQYVFLNENRISRLESDQFGRLPIVFEVRLDANNISSISVNAFNGLLQLLRLNLSRNSLVEVPPQAFQGLVSLQSLDLSHNQITHLENKTHGLLEALLSLEYLNASHNRLSLITERSFPTSPYIPYKLKHIDLSFNFIPVLTAAFDDGMSKVEWLSVKHNVINEIRSGVISNITSLKFFDISENQISKLPKGTFGTNLVNLQELLLNANRIETLDGGELLRMKSLRVLDVRDNGLKSVYNEIVQLATKGVEVNLSGNALHCDCHLKSLLVWLSKKSEGKSTKSNWFSVTCNEPLSLQGTPLIQLRLRTMQCIGESQADVDNESSDVMFRGLQRAKRHDDVIRVVWFVLNKDDDISAFKLTVNKYSDRNGEPDLIPVPYNQREYILRNVDVNTRYKICLTAVDSRGNERKTFQSQCTSSDEARSFFDYASATASLEISICCFLLSLIAFYTEFVCV